MNSTNLFPLSGCCLRTRLILSFGVLFLSGLPATRAAEMARTFSTPDEAVQSLVAAVNSADRSTLRNIFGPNVDDITSPDPVQAKNELKTFAEDLKQGHRVVSNSQTQAVLEIGYDNFPFPVPIVKKQNRWFFDTDAGKEEIINRRIGRNELDTLNSVRAYVEAQREYASRDRNNDEVLEYAQKFASAPGKKDGLYWAPDIDGELSPLGPLVVKAQSEGYLKKQVGPNVKPEPFHGYYFKILTRQGKSVPGGKYDYVINDHMIGGFGLVAYPAEYGESGIMTFVVNQRGKVYQKDLGPKTAQLAPDIKEYNLDKTWAVSRD